MRCFVTGTDTEVGKTAVTSCLAQAARPRGVVVAAKVVASGVEPGGAGEDAEALAEAAGHPPKILATFRAPVSPHRAALLEGGAPTVEELDAFCRGLRGDVVLVEGAGGWRVPVLLGDPIYETRDLARATGGAVLVVAPDKLGVLNHARLTLEAIRADGLVVAGLVVNRGAAPADASRPWNVEDLRRLLDVPVAVLERVDLRDPEARRAAGDALWTALSW